MSALKNEIREDIALIDIAIEQGWQPWVRGENYGLSKEEALSLAGLGKSISYVRAFNKDKPDEMTHLWKTHKGWQMATIVNGSFTNHYINKRKTYNNLSLKLMLNVVPLSIVQR